MSTDQLDEIQWKSPEFIQERGLHTGNVLEYFALSPFYDRTSNNQVLMMQFQFQQIQIPMGMTFQQYFQNRLQEMTGVEFVIAYNREPDFWVVRKQQRIDPQNTISLQDYYIIGANVYQAPKIYHALSSRLLSSVLSLKNSIDLLNNMTKYHISDGGHSYNNTQQTNTSSATPSIQNSSAQKSSSLTVNNTGPVNTVTPIPIQTPQTVGGGIGTSSVGSAVNHMTNTESNIEITSSAFNSLLNNVVQSSGAKTVGGGASGITINTPGDGREVNTSIYLDDIPLYGKGSTVEMLGLKVNLEGEEL